jgi:putative pyruvate formate lyase activating enzyme
MQSSALSRYHQILDGNQRANYLLTKGTAVDVTLDLPTEDLWRTHNLAIEGGFSPGGRTSLLDLKIELARRMLERCNLCERRCGTNRLIGKTGYCGVRDSRVSSEFIHMGEEPDLVPSYTIFFSGCTFKCVYCQNWDISTRPESGDMIPAEHLAKMIERKGGRVRNVNWVGGDPTSNLPFVTEVLGECSANLPQVWNSNMYLSKDSMNLLDGIIDVYLTDFKYGNDNCALRLSDAPDYLRIVRRNHLLARENAEMIVRHLVLPGHLDCCTKPVLAWISENLDDVKVNVMAQYRPEHRAHDFSELSREINRSEFEAALRIAEKLNLDLCD